MSSFSVVLPAPRADRDLSGLVDANSPASIAGMNTVAREQGDAWVSYGPATPATGKIEAEPSRFARFGDK